MKFVQRKNCVMNMENVLFYTKTKHRDETFILTFHFADNTKTGFTATEKEIDIWLDRLRAFLETGGTYLVL